VTIIVADFQSSVEDKLSACAERHINRTGQVHNDRDFKDSVEERGLLEEMGKRIGKVGRYEPFGTSISPAGTLFGRMLLIWK
jgi:hypothetical protein